jgi:hypothetical protein
VRFNGSAAVRSPGRLRIWSPDQRRRPGRASTRRIGGDVRAAARYFRIPSVFIDGPGPAITIRSLTQAEVANAALPCGAEFLSAAQRGPFVNVLFRLTGRSGPGGSSCGSGAGTTARTNFVIRSGRISVWLRAPDQPGDNGSPTGAPSSGGSVI